jgi:hypothetical protein
MIKSSRPIRYKEIGMAVVKALFTEANDSLYNPLSDMGALTTVSYKRRHVVTGGGFDLIGVNTSINKKTDRYYYIDYNKDHLFVWPNEIADTNRIFGIIDAFEIMATEDNSSYFCVVPNEDGFLVKHEITSFQSNVPFQLLKGNLYFANRDVTVDGNLIKAYSPIAVITDDKTAISNEDGGIGRFYVVKAG